MGFSAKNKEDILVASARHCCVCHRYKGVKVEVHHIIPKASGGEDSYDNAIALCFDCHSDAGHYYAEHPRGTKFSPTELSKHKEAWFQIVRRNNIPIYNEENTLLVRYLITSEFELLKEMLANDLQHFPISNTLFIETPPLFFLRDLFKNQKFRRTEYASSFVVPEKDYLNHFPNAKSYNSDSVFSHYIHSRIPTIDEIKQNCQGDDLSIHLASQGVHPSKIAQVLTRYEECGDTTFEELYIVRPLYLSLLTITNISNSPITLGKVDFNYSDGLLYKQQADSKIHTINLPQISVFPNQCIVIPIGNILPNFEDFEKHETSFKEIELSSEESQVLSHGKIISRSEIEFVGPSLTPTKIYYDNTYQSFHEFDFANLYWIDRHWRCGSCPHLFHLKSDGKIEYKGELFAAEPNQFITESFLIPKGVNFIIITELEREITLIKSIVKNSQIIETNLTLVENTEIKIEVEPNDSIKVEGKYFYKSEVFRKTPIHEKEKLVRKYINKYLQ